MSKISPEMTLRDIAEAIQRGELKQEDAEVSAALKDRARVALAAFNEIAAMVERDALANAYVESDGGPLTVAVLFPLLGDDPEKLERARRAIGRIEDSLGPNEPGKACFRRSGEAA